MNMGGGGGAGGGGAPPARNINIFRTMADLLLFRGKRSLDKREAKKPRRVFNTQFTYVSARFVKRLATILGRYSEAWYKRIELHRASHVLVDLGWVDLDLGSSSSRSAATVATYCPSRVVEHPKSKSTKPSPRGHGTPCMYTWELHVHSACIDDSFRILGSFHLR